MMTRIAYNGYIYNKVERPGRAGEEVLRRWTPGSTLLTSFMGKPAVVIKGEIYTQGRSIDPSRPDWEKIKKRIG